MEPILVDSHEVARRLGLSRAQVCDLARRGVIPRIKVNQKTVRYDMAAVLAALKVRSETAYPVEEREGDR